MLTLIGVSAASLIELFAIFALPVRPNARPDWITTPPPIAPGAPRRKGVGAIVAELNVEVGASIGGGVEMVGEIGREVRIFTSMLTVAVPKFCVSTPSPPLLLTEMLSIVSVIVPVLLNRLKLFSTPSSMVVLLMLAVPVRPVVPLKTPKEMLPSSKPTLLPFLPDRSH